jgi:hypothetical protein
MSLSLSETSSSLSIHTSITDEYDDYYEDWIIKSGGAIHSVYLVPVLPSTGILFIAASFLPSLWSSEFIGYTAIADITGEAGHNVSMHTLLDHLRKAYNKSLPVVHYYPALCASTVLMVYSFKSNIMSFVFAGSCTNTYF